MTSGTDHIAMIYRNSVKQFTGTAPGHGHPSSSCGSCGVHYIPKAAQTSAVQCDPLQITNRFLLSPDPSFLPTLWLSALLPVLTPTLVTFVLVLASAAHLLGKMYKHHIQTAELLKSSFIPKSWWLWYSVFKITANQIKI